MVDMESMLLRIFLRFFINLFNYLKFLVKGKGMLCKIVECINLIRR